MMKICHFLHRVSAYRVTPTRAPTYLTSYQPNEEVHDDEFHVSCRAMMEVEYCTSENFLNVG
jgi:hypothetical protein